MVIRAAAITRTKSIASIGAASASCVAHMGQGIEPILIDPGGDDLAVMLGRRVEVMVVVIQAGVAQPRSLRGCQHSQRDATFQPERAYPLYHGTDRVQVAVLR